MPLIDKDALMIEFAKYAKSLNVASTISTPNEPTWNNAVLLVESAPTVDAVPVKNRRCEDCKWRMPTFYDVPVVHGEWVHIQRPNGGYYTGCSVCSFPIPTDSMFDYMDETDNRFCYNCGAKMDGKEKNDEQ